jgi:hypothetical protein
MCFSSARIASFALSPYFSRSASPLVTCMSSSGLPMQKSGYVWGAIVGKGGGWRDVVGRMGAR